MCTEGRVAKDLYKNGRRILYAMWEGRLVLWGKHGLEKKDRWEPCMKCSCRCLRLTLRGGTITLLYRQGSQVLEKNAQLENLYCSVLL